MTKIPDHICAACGYNRTERALDNICPECGLVSHIADSVRRRRLLNLRLALIGQLVLAAFTWWFISFLYGSGVPGGDVSTILGVMFMGIVILAYIAVSIAIAGIALRSKLRIGRTVCKTTNISLWFNALITVSVLCAAGPILMAFFFSYLSPI